MINPLLFAGALVGVLTTLYLFVFIYMKKKKALKNTTGHTMKNRVLITRLAEYIRPHVKQLLLAACVLLCSVVYDIISPYLVGVIEERIKGSFVLAELFFPLAIYIVLLLGSLVATYAQSILLKKTGDRILSDIRRDLFYRIETLSHAQLTKEPVGKLVTRVSTDTNAIANAFTKVLFDLFKNAFFLIGVLIAMFCLSTQLALMILCFTPLVAVFTLIFAKFSKHLYRNMQQGTTELNVFLSENFSGIKITQLFNQEESKINTFCKKSKALCNAHIGHFVVGGVFFGTLRMIRYTSVLCLFYLGAKGIFDGTTFLGQTLTGGIIVSFYMYISKFFTTLQSLFSAQLPALQESFTSAEKVFSVLDMESEITDAPDAVELSNVKGEITFEHVWFSYLPGEWVLKDVSFHINAGDTAAFVGQTGSGKSTILGLLCRNYDVQKGRILVDGIDIRTIKLASLRSHFGQMLQDVFLFSGTIRENLVMGKEQVADEEVWQACHYVNADRFISQTTGKLDESVDRNGSNFSAGQRQLLSFARTMLHNPSVMILDEATANIDTETELLIQNSLEKMMQIGTMLIVAHRLSTIQNANKIFVLSHGEVVEEGTHTELLAARGRYYRLYEMQEHNAHVQ